MTNNNTIKNTAFVPSCKTYHEDKIALIDLRRKVREGRDERLAAMKKFLFANKDVLFAERDLATMFDLDFRDVIGARQAVYRDYEAQSFKIQAYDIPTELQLCVRCPSYLRDGDNVQKATLNIYSKKVAVKWQALDENDEPIPGRVNFRYENQFFWKFSDM